MFLDSDDLNGDTERSSSGVAESSSESEDDKIKLNGKMIARMYNLTEEVYLKQSRKRGKLDTFIYPSLFYEAPSTVYYFVLFPNFHAGRKWTSST